MTVGSLIRGQQYISGLMYRRNPYYDPMTGQFTQSDPIGIAGGLNTYGFAAGDPVSYADPYGLEPDTLRALAEALWFNNPTAIRLNSTFFVYQHIGDAGHVLGHELGHLMQKKVHGLIYGEQTDAAGWNALVHSRGDNGPGDAYYQASQDDADRYGCSVAVGMVNMKIAGVCQ